MRGFRSMEELCIYYAEERDDLSLVESSIVEEYIWKDKAGRGESPTSVIYFLVEDDDGKQFIVVLGRSPFTGEYHIWCGDKELRTKLQVPYSFCSFWKRGTCRHVRYVAHMLKTNSSIRSLVDEWERMLEGEKENSTSLPTSREKEVEMILSLNLPTLIYGPTGSGKTYTILSTLQQKKEAGELEYQIINFSSGVEDTDLLAKFIPTPDGKWNIIDGELTRAFKTARELPEGKKLVLILEEVSRAPAKTLNLLVKAMDPFNGVYRLQNFVSGEDIEVPTHKIQFIGLANLGSSYGGTEELDPAFMRRFQLTRFWDYDQNREKEILVSILGDEEVAKRILRWVEAQRSGYREGIYPYPVDTGTLKTTASLMKKLGVPFWNAFEMTGLLRIVERDTYGYPDEGQVESLKEFADKLGLC